MCSMAFLTSASPCLRPMKRLTEKIVFSGLVIACRLATCPTSRSPVRGFTATTDGVSRPPSAFSSTLGSPASITATTEFVVPRSIPRTFAIALLLLAPSSSAGVEAAPLEDAIEPRDQGALLLRQGASYSLVLGDVAPQAADLLGDAEREPDAGHVDAALLAQRLDLLQPGHIVARVETEVAVRARRAEQLLALVLAQRVGVHPGQARGDADHEDRVVRSHRCLQIFTPQSIESDTLRGNVDFTAI